MTRTLGLLLLVLPLMTSAATLREKLQERREERAQQRLDAKLPAGSRVLHDQPYGEHPRQRFDVYLPPAAKQAPILFMVHGGGWHTGDKAMAAVVENKARHWLNKGYVLVSSNYRLIPDADPLAQAADVAEAFASVQQQAAGWGGDPARMVLMGHSAGAHLVSLLASDSTLAPNAKPLWLGTVALDSAAFDVPAIMHARHYPLYDKAFGSDTALWRAASPLRVLRAGAGPLLAVCSTRRDDACPQADAYAAKAATLGMRVSVLRQDLSHRAINQELGAEPAYTAAVDAFLNSLGLP
ncbi:MULTISPECIES: alpha/beta hydrolase [unclassified Pseudomonas]|uniref:alpha/beta hydrolase n=1 Tax=unclassified Pseudomonas TaxID=196821 RepID=UPI00244D2437|nr:MULTISPECIES: alpha/beta hydrolase [unclassified Pseudomonas]MDG9923545.1 alpha/beta hydrolase [Pseudomonas sp. GD04045]MDH0036307.1 alpha/beta hydrolase [Pseudomonas sp. GD04019]